MNQSSVIGGSIILAYVIFVIAKGELPCYLEVLGIATGAQCPSALAPPGCASSSTTTTSGSPVAKLPVLGRGGGGGLPIGIGVTLPGLPGGIGVGIGF